MGMRNPDTPARRLLSMKYNPPADSGLPLAGRYLMVSTSKQEDGTSLEVQGEECLALLLSDGFRTEEEFTYREVWTGADKDRPELARLMADVKAGR